MRYIVYFEDDTCQLFDYIKDAAEVWAAYPSSLECMVVNNETGLEIDDRTLESVLGYKKAYPRPLKPKSRVAYMY